MTPRGEPRPSPAALERYSLLKKQALLNPDVEHDEWLDYDLEERAAQRFAAVPESPSPTQLRLKDRTAEV